MTRRCTSCHRTRPLANSDWCAACWSDWWRAKTHVVDAVKREHEKARRA